MGIIEFDKSGREYGGVRINENIVSVEGATTRLRRRIHTDWLRVPRRIASLIWILARLLLKEALLFLFALVFLFGGAHNTWNFLIGFGAGSLYLLWRAYGETGWTIIKRHEKGGILIGDSFRHYTESQQSGKPVAVGADGEHHIDYLGQPNPHVLMLGSTSSGKTTTMRAFVSRVSLESGINFLLLDWNGENEAFAKSINATVWKVPQHFKVNLFKLNGMTKEARASMAVDSLVVAAHLTALQSTKVKSALLKFYLNGKEPSLFELWSALCSRDTGKVNVLNQRLRAIQRVIGTEPDEFWNGIFMSNNVISLAGLNESEKSLVAYAIMQRLTELFDKNPEPSPKLRLMVVLDEAWQLFRREKEFETLRESAVEKIVRLGRKYGVGIIISTQQIEDAPKVFLNSSSLLMLHQHRELSYYGKDLLNLDAFERAYIESAAQGEMLLLDRGREQDGQWFSEYVRVKPLNLTETVALSARYKQNTPATIEEPEMPIEEYDRKREEGNGAANGELREPIRIRAKTKIALPKDAPTPPQYAGLLAIYNNPDSPLNELVKYIKSRGWFTSSYTLYGATGKPGIFENLVKSEFAKEEGNKYTLTEKGLGWVDADKLMENQADKLGSEEHKRLMRKAIKYHQDRLNLVVISGEKHAFDLVAIPVNQRKRSLWNISRAKGYEVQTTARKESVDVNKNKSELWNMPMVWTADDKTVLELIRQQTSNGNEYLLI